MNIHTHPANQNPWSFTSERMLNVEYKELKRKISV
uniref:Uncharacterized protein n=1 Tax=Anguilla anguilla TaxID=7936 RepID=A0A0E9TUS3_ANGAN